MSTTDIFTQLRTLPECCYRVSVKALIYDDQGRILLVKEGNDKWDLPGGGTDHGESLEDSLKRELQEEIGLDVEIGELHDIVKFQSRSGIHALWMIYECQALHSDLTLGEASDTQWVSPDQATEWPLPEIKGLG